MIQIHPTPEVPRATSKSDHRLASMVVAVATALSIALSGCANPSGRGGVGGAAITNCAMAGIGAAAVAALYQVMTNPNRKIDPRKVSSVGAAFCAVGIAATVVGNALNKSQQEKQDRAFQTAAARQAGGTAPPPAPAPAVGPTPTPRPTQPPSPAAAPAAPQTIGAAQWSDAGSNGGAVPTGPSVATSDGNQCVPIKEWAQVNGRYVEQEVQACRPMADASGQFQRVVPKA